MPRLFFAVNLPDDARHACAAELEQLLSTLGRAASGLRPVRPEGVHFTLKFLGDVPDDRVPALREAATRVASRHGAFDVVLEGLHALPSTSRPRVVHVPAVDGAKLAAIAKDLDTALAPLGSPKEERAFLAHATLARVKDFRSGRAAGQAIEKWDQKKLGEFRVESIDLMQSELGAGGSRYTRLFTAKLSSP